MTDPYRKWTVGAFGNTIGNAEGATMTVFGDSALGIVAGALCFFAQCRHESLWLLGHRAHETSLAAIGPVSAAL
jgi:hypothetical protein